MRLNTITKTFTIAAATALVLGITPTANAADKGCTNLSLQGTFAYTSTGSIASPPEIAGPIAEVGTQVFDGKGGTTATATISSNGSMTQLVITGTYTLNADCTGTMALQVSPFNITVHVLFVMDTSLNGFQAMETDDGLIITRVARSQFGIGDWRR
jgi:hypothetical protein